MLDRASLEYPLYQAVAADKADVVELYLKKDAKGNSTFDGTTALHVAIAKKNLTVLKLFLRYQCDLSAKNQQGQTPIAAASQIGFWEGVIMIAESKRDDNDLFQFGSALLDATKANHMPAVQALLKAGAYTNWYHPHNGYRPLHNAVKNNNPEMITLLLQYGADPSVKNTSGKPIELAAINEYWNCVIAFAKTKNERNDTYAYGYALLFASVANQLSVVRALLEAEAKTEWYMTDTINTALHNAVVNNNPVMVAMLVSHKANKNTVNKYQETPLNMATRLQRWNCVKAILEPERYYTPNTQIILFYLFAANSNVQNNFSKLPGDVLRLILNLVFKEQYVYGTAYREYVTLRDKRQFVARAAKFVAEYSQFGLLRRVVGAQSSASLQFVSTIDKIVNVRQPIEKKHAQIQGQIVTFTANKGENISRAVKLLIANNLFKLKQSEVHEGQTAKKQFNP